MPERSRFHLACPVRDLAEARARQGDLLECPEGRFRASNRFVHAGIHAGEDSSSTSQSPARGKQIATGLCGRESARCRDRRVCKGPIVKLYIADYPLYLAGEDCIAAVEKSPENYLPRPAAPSPNR